MKSWPWKYRTKNNRKEILRHEEFKFAASNPKFESSAINQEFERVNKKWPIQEFLVEISNRLYIEPLFGMGLHGLRFIDPTTVSFWGTNPSFSGYITSKWRKKNTLESAVIFDYNLGLNYFHFFNDVLPKLFLIDSNSLENYPLLIHERIFNCKHFQFLFQELEFVRNRPWLIVQDNTYFEVRQSWHIKPMGYQTTYQTKIQELLIKFKSKLEPSKKIFLNRSLKSGRNISNMDELKTILHDQNFLIIETEKLSIPEQLLIFSEASHIISIHGAGNTNLLFSPKSVRFLEIMPKNKISSHYYWLANSLNVDYYSILLGETISPKIGSKDGVFRVDPLALKKSIQQLLGN